MPCLYVTPTLVIVDWRALYTCLRELKGNAPISPASEIEWQKECKTFIFTCIYGYTWNTPQ